MTVHFIGAGPGAPDLITVRGLKLIERCPVCLYAGSLVPPEVVAAAPNGAEVIDTSAMHLDEIIAKMVEGTIAKFKKDNALLSQLFVMDNKTPVADVVAQAAKEAGTAIVLKGFTRFQLGEGIEKKQEDFAAEVAAAAGSSKAEPVA